MIVGTEGDAGDIIYVLGILNELQGGPHRLLLQRSDVTSLRTTEAVNRVYDLLRGLVSTQPYIEDFRPEVPHEDVDWRSGQFRNAGFHYMGYSLLASHVNYLIDSKKIGRGINGTKKWLFVEPSNEPSGRVIINRTHRYQNPFFQWTEIVRHYGDRILFVGLPHEHQTFCMAHGAVEYVETKDFLEVAKLIAGSDLFIGNQSSPNAIAEGLKHTSIQETNLNIPDCIFRRSNAQHVFNGSCYLPNVSGSGDLYIKPQTITKINRKTHMPPPGGWRFNGRQKSMSLHAMVDGIYKSENRRRSRAEIEREVVDANIALHPEYFRDKSFDRIFDAFHTAHENAAC